MTATAPVETARRPFSWRRWARRFCLRLAAYWILYTLSIGPMFWPWYESTFLNGPPWVKVFYGPLVYFCDSVPLYGRFVNWYINLWILR